MKLSPYPAPTTISPALWLTSAASGASTVTVLSLSSIPFLKVGLCRLKIKRLAGAAANFTPLIFSEVNVTTAGDVSQEYAGAATAVGTLHDPGTLQSAPIPMVTDANGRLYLVFGPDAGADNTFKYMLRFFVYG